jgi:hypothetical protein
MAVSRSAVGRSRRASVSWERGSEFSELPRAGTFGVTRVESIEALCDLRETGEQIMQRQG